jgi:hypothetical protein
VAGAAAQSSAASSTAAQRKLIIPEGSGNADARQPARALLPPPGPPFALGTATRDLPTRPPNRRSIALSLITLLIIEFTLVAFFVFGYVLWRRNRSADDDSRRDDARRRAPLLVLLAGAAAFAAGCEREERLPHDTDTPAASPLASEDGGFAILAGSDTIAVERFRRAENRIDGELLDRRSGARLVYGAALDPASRVRRLDIELYGGDAAEPQVRASVAFAGDTVIIEQHVGGELSDDRSVLPPGTTIYLNPSIAMIELLIERAAADTTFPMLSLSTDAGPRLVEPTVARVNDSVRFSIPGDADVILRVEDRSRIVGGESTGGAARFVRLP